MKKLALTMILLVFSINGVEAKVLRLNSGQTVEGVVKEETDEYYMLEIDGYMMTYYKDNVIEAVDHWSELSVENGEEPSDALAELDNLLNQIDGDDEQPHQNAASYQEAGEVQLTNAERRLIDGMNKRELILQFMDSFGTRAALRASYQQMITKLSPDQVDAIKNTVTVESIIDQIIPLYEEAFTTEELRKYVAFYSSNEGRKLLRTIPLLMQKSVETSMRYFQQVMPDSTY